jgi:hypothetical protein
MKEAEPQYTEGYQNYHCCATLFLRIVLFIQKNPKKKFQKKLPVDFPKEIRNSLGEVITMIPAGKDNNMIRIMLDFSDPSDEVYNERYHNRTNVNEE